MTSEPERTPLQRACSNYDTLMTNLPQLNDFEVEDLEQALQVLGKALEDLRSQHEQIYFVLSSISLGVRIGEGEFAKALAGVARDVHDSVMRRNQMTPDDPHRRN